MAKSNGVAETAPPLPSLDSITSVAASELPASNTGPAMTADEIALAKAIVAAAQDGKYAVGPKADARADATAAGARMRRLVSRYIGTLGQPKAERPTVSTRIVPKDGGRAWALTLGAPKAATPAAEAGNADTAANVAAGVTS